MNKRKLLIVSVTILIAIVIIIAGLIMFIDWPIDERWDSIDGTLRPIENNSSTNSIVFLMNVTDDYSDKYTVDSNALEVYIFYNTTHLTSENYSWDYIDENLNGFLDTGDILIVYLDSHYFGENITVSIRPMGVTIGWIWGEYP